MLQNPNSQSDSARAVAHQRGTAIANAFSHTFSLQKSVSLKPKAKSKAPKAPKPKRAPSVKDPRQQAAASRAWRTRRGAQSAEDEKKASSPGKTYNLNVTQKIPGISAPVLTYLRQSPAVVATKAGKTGKPIPLHEMVEIDTPHGTKVAGIVISRSPNHSYVLTGQGTFNRPHAEVKRTRKKVLFDWKKMASVAPTPGSIVDVLPSSSGKNSDGRLQMSVKRILAEKLPADPKAKVKVLYVRHGRPQAIVEEVHRDRILGPYIPEKFFDEQEKLRTRKIPDKLKTNEQLEREATNLTYVKFLDKKRAKQLSAAEDAWFSSHQGALKNIAMRVAKKMLMGGDNQGDLESYANIGALYAFRQWARNTKEQKAMKLRNMAKHEAYELGFEAGTPEHGAYVTTRMASMAKEMSEDQMRDRHALAGAYQEATRRADELMDISGMTGLNPAQLKQVARAQRELFSMRGSKPDEAAIASYLGWPGEEGIARVRLALAKQTARRASRMSEMERTTDGGEVTSLDDRLADKAPMEAETNKEAQDDARAKLTRLASLAGLDERQRHLMDLALDRELDADPRSAGQYIAALMRVRYGTMDTEGHILNEWETIKRRLAMFAQMRAKQIEEVALHKGAAVIGRPGIRLGTDKAGHRHWLAVEPHHVAAANSLHVARRLSRFADNEGASQASDQAIDHILRGSIELGGDHPAASHFHKAACAAMSACGDYARGDTQKGLLGLREARQHLLHARRMLQPETTQ